MESFPKLLGIQELNLSLLVMCSRKLTVIPIPDACQAIVFSLFLRIYHQYQPGHCENGDSGKKVSPQTATMNPAHLRS